MVNKKEIPKESELDKESEEENGEVIESKLDEESELEEGNIEDSQFQEFIRPSIEESTPILERIAGPQGTGFSLSGWESVSNQNITEAGENDPFKYSVGGTQEEEAKYISSEHMATAPAHIDLREVGRRQPEINQEGLFTQSSELRDIQSLPQEKYEPAKRMDIESAGRKDPFKSEERKYDPRLPSS